MEIDKLEKQVGEGWANLLKPFMVKDDKGETPYNAISVFLKEQKDNNATFFPDGKDVFKAFRATPLETVRVVMLGQDPYFKEGYANGLAFGTDNKQVPVSLQTMYKGIEADVHTGLDFKAPTRTGDLSSWCQQGVLLLNTALTVEKDKAGSHMKQWAPFTDFLIKELSAVKRDLVWIGFGAEAKELTKNINPFRSFVYLAEHPAYAARQKRDWLHNNVFTKTNLALTLNGLGDAIKW